MQLIQISAILPGDMGLEKHALPRSLDGRDWDTFETQKKIVAKTKAGSLHRLGQNVPVLVQVSNYGIPGYKYTVKNLISSGVARYHLGSLHLTYT